MTEAGWTRKKPTVAGFYWHRDPDSLVLSMIYVTLSGEPTVIYTCSGFKMSLAEHSRCSSEWLGPITPDSFQQGRAAGLREALENLERLENRDTRLQTDVEDFYVWIDDQLAQAAQDEKGVGDAGDV